ncbi:MAG TPA: DHH family phosphoesterase [Candidatus Sulfotelmatobacter sp.]|nr:DHH family phosphoesterase [Candidatus Sulfotelmatobacter sp.]
MKFIVTHTAPDMDAITSVWLIRKFLGGWDKAEVKFVPAGDRLLPLPKGQSLDYAIEKKGVDEYIHVDTGMGPLDHHQTSDTNVCGTSLTFDFVKRGFTEVKPVMNKEKLEALERIVKYVVGIDHFQEIFRKDPLADYQDFSVVNILDGLKLQKPGQDNYYVDFISNCLDAILHDFENKVWSEREIEKNSIKFDTKWGKGLGLETINDSVIKMAQLMGYVVVVRRDPRKGYVRIKARPNDPGNSKGIDLTLAYEKLSKMDPSATWFLHVSKKMLLNGTPKNPKMKPTKLSLNDIIGVLKTI